MPQLLIGVSKVNRYASRDSGDTVEVIERPSGGISVLLADAQGSGAAAKNLSNMVIAHAVALIKDGVRDSTVHEAVHDHLFHYKGGRVSCTLTTVTADLRRAQYIITRNSHAPVLLVDDEEVAALASGSAPLGIRESMEPTTFMAPLSLGLRIIVMTDGVSDAGARTGQPLDLASCLEEWQAAHMSPPELAARVLSAAVEQDRGRPVDDMTVVAIAAVEGGDEGEPRLMSVQVPLRQSMVVGKEP